MVLVIEENSAEPSVCDKITELMFLKDPFTLESMVL